MKASVFQTLAFFGLAGRITCFGFTKVANIDMSKSALTTGRLNHRINNISTDNVTFMPYNILKDLFAENCPQFVYKEQLSNSLDFPSADDERALKCLLFQKC